MIRITSAIATEGYSIPVAFSPLYSALNTKRSYFVLDMLRKEFSLLFSGDPPPFSLVQAEGEPPCERFGHSAVLMPNGGGISPINHTDRQEIALDRF